MFDKFKKLQQVSTVEAYFDDFEKCRGQLLMKIPSLTTEYFLENFIGGLQNDIRGMLRLLEPTTLEQALKLARFYEQTLNSQPKKSNYASGSYKNTTTSLGSKVFNGANTSTGNNSNSSLLIPSKTTEVVNSKPRPLTFSQREERRQKGLCFYCDEKFAKGHECKKPQSFLMVAEDEEAAGYEGEPKFDEAPGETEEDWQDQKIILAALGMDTDVHQPLQFKGLIDNKEMNILIDGGSSKNLVHSQVCKELGLTTQPQAPMNLFLANGDVLTSTLVCPTVRWKWGITEFCVEAQVVDLGELQMILGVEWLSQLGNVHCNYQSQTMEFQWKGEQIKLPSALEVEKGQIHQLSVVTPVWMEQIGESYVDDELMQKLISEYTIIQKGPQEYYMRQGLLQYRGKWVIGATGDLRRQIFEELHNNGIGGHSGRQATLKRIRSYFYWPTINQNVGQWVRECSTCQQVKGETVKSPGLLQPLAIPQEPWRDIAMDFITGLPKSKGSEVIWVIVDRFSRYGHFLALSHPITAKGLAMVFFEQIYRLHGMPESIVSDRDSLFLSEFWQALFKLSGTRLHLSTAYHPQSDGSTERVNQCLEQYLRSMTSQNPKNWSTWLGPAEWWYNTTFHTTLNTTPYQVVYGT